jgi:hypothetical protein
MPLGHHSLSSRRQGGSPETEGLNVSLAGADDELAQIDRRSRTTAVDLGFPSLTHSISTSSH